MKENYFIFCHGFGFDKTFWDPLKPYFATQKTLYLDLGYFGAETYLVLEPEQFNYIGIGHSLGLMKLLSFNISMSHLIGLHGFIHFLGFDATLNQLRMREWLSLKKYFLRAPELTLKQFYQRVGVPFEIHKKTIQTIKLQQDLDALKQTFDLPGKVPTLILGAVDDPVVPPVLIEDNFSSQNHVTIDILNQGQHGLGFLNSALVYQKIMRFIE